VLKTLQDIRVSYLDEDQPGFKLHFKFGPNDYFSDSELVKTYYYQVGDAAPMSADGRKRSATEATLCTTGPLATTSSGRRTRT
jgi:hypothetical protein